MTEYLPIAVRLKNRRTLVVGGGPVALRKVMSLLDAGGEVTVISPEAVEGIRSFADSGKVLWVPRHVKEDDIDGTALVIAATDDSSVNESVSRWAKERDIPVNVVDRPVISDFISPAIIRTGKAIVAIYTDGKDPVLSRDLKNYLKEKWNDFISYRDRS